MHQIFAITRKPELTSEEEARVAYLRKQQETAHDLGLAAQVALLRDQIVVAERGTLITQSPMTTDEEAIWREWLPTVYYEHSQGSHSLMHYEFDRIPQPVLEQWQAHKASGLFDGFEIWTPEVRQPDPILVGVVGDVRYMLARWGESDANFASFDDIKRELQRRWHAKQDFSELIFLAALAMIPAGLLAIGVQAGLTRFGILAAPPESVVCAVAAVVGGVFTYFFTRRRLSARNLRDDRLMQAIARDDRVRRES